MAASQVIAEVTRRTVDNAKREFSRRTYRASNELLTASHDVLRRPGGGRLYKNHRASAPGQPPAVDSGVFSGSWAPKPRIEGGGTSLTAVAAIESNETVGGYVLGELLEGGTSRMAARPYKDKIIEAALPKITQIYSAPY